MEGGDDGEAEAPPPVPPPRKTSKKPKKRKEGKSDDGNAPRKKARNKARSRANNNNNSNNADANGISAEQRASNELMRRALEEDKYSAQGSIVDTDSDEEDNYVYRGHGPIRLDRAAMRKYAQRETTCAVVVGGGGGHHGMGLDDEDAAGGNHRRSRPKKKSKKKGGGGGGDNDRCVVPAQEHHPSSAEAGKEHMAGGGAHHDHHLAGVLDGSADDDLDREGSIFGQTTGSSNSTWVECDKCKKWRRLRGVVDEKKLPSKWYCSMNKNDPERARCSAPEEVYETPTTPESAADARTRKHLRVWVRRLQCNEAYESRQPTLTRGKKRAVSSGSKDPYEWVRCCNPSCGKWRAILRIMDARTNVIDRTTDGEWYCVMNTWDEKTASCAAPQENLPAVGCPPIYQEQNNSNNTRT